ncbi:MAG: hypothetical protein R2836_04430 [Chitinophagales bacterium]
MLEWEGWEVDEKKESAQTIKEAVQSFFKEFNNIDTSILDFDSNLPKNNFDKQHAYQLWHLLYSAEDDKTLKKALLKYGFDENKVTYWLMFPCKQEIMEIYRQKLFAKYYLILKDEINMTWLVLMRNTSIHDSETKEDKANKNYEAHLEPVKKNSLRNPIVEKILNQVVNVVNAVIDDKTMGTLMK